MTWKPEGYPTVSPYLVVHNAQTVVQFCSDLLAATETRRHTRPDGSIMHTEIRIGDSVIMIADATAEWSPVPAMLHVYVPDVDSTYERALELGATSQQKPSQGDDGDRRCGVLDAAGNSWWFGSKIG